MPELGRYAAEVLLAYGVTAALVGGLVVQSVLAARAARRALDREAADSTLGRQTR